ncbi:MAG: DUF1003 domain-containing protein, partial [Tabrizicola sp.]|nr:DUF1003 domain-containing protein [Tabrizicola sp.]
IQSAMLVVWIVLNITAYVYRWDPYPFILLNLAMSFQAAYAAPAPHRRSVEACPWRGVPGHRPWPLSRLEPPHRGLGAEASSRLACRSFRIHLTP